MDKLLLIDGNNMAMRSAYTFAHLSVPLVDFTKEFNPDYAMDDRNNFPTGVLHGFFKSIAALKSRYPDYYIAIVWDGGYQRRTDLTKSACEKGMLSETYKENRRKKEPDEITKNYIRQKEKLRASISMTNMPQIIVDGEEADDVIASYVDKYLNQVSKIILCTNDKDYYQLINDKVYICRSEEIVDNARFSNLYEGISPNQWVEIAAFSGDQGDNIFGVPGWGDTTAMKAIREHGNFENVMKKYHSDFDHLRVVHPDLDETSLQELISIKNSNGKKRYPNISVQTPFTGVALALESGKVKKMPKVALTALMYEERALLARVLKTMKRDIEIPDLPNWDRDKSQDFISFCQQHGLREVATLAGCLCSTQPS